MLTIVYGRYAYGNTTWWLPNGIQRAKQPLAHFKTFPGLPITYVITLTLLHWLLMSYDKQKRNGEHLSNWFSIIFITDYNTESIFKWINNVHYSRYVDVT